MLPYKKKRSMYTSVFLQYPAEISPFGEKRDCESEEKQGIIFIFFKEEGYMKGKKLLAGILTLAMLLSAMPMTAWAEEDLTSNPVAAIGDTEYATLNEAFAAAPTDGTKTTVTLLRDIDLTAADLTTVKNITNRYGVYAHFFAAHAVKGQNIVLDMDEHEITLNYAKDELPEGDYRTLGGNGVIGAENGGKLLITGNGTIKVLEENNDGATTFISVVWALSIDSELTIENGYFSGTDNVTVAYASHGGELYINGGKFTKETSKESVPPADEADSTEISYVVLKDTSCPDLTETGENNGAVTELVIKGGIFEGVDPDGYCPLYTGEWTTEDVVPKGYKSVSLGDNLWEVVQDKKETSKKSSSSPKYQITVEDSENGTVESSRTKAKKGTTITLTAFVEEGYELEGFTVLDKNGDVVSVTEKNGKYIFKMPRGNVTVEADFTKTAEKESAEEQREIRLTIGEKVAWVFDKYVVNDTAPEMRNDRTMLPIRFIVEALGGTVTWNADTQTVSIVKGDTQIAIYIGQSFALVNGSPVELDAPAYIANGRTYLPLRFVAENLGATVTWNGETQTITIIA